VAVLLMAWPDMEEIMPHMEGGNSTKKILQDKRISGMEKSQKISRSFQMAISSSGLTIRHIFLL
jgi:hypothetical protein